MHCIGLSSKPIEIGSATTLSALRFGINNGGDPQKIDEVAHPKLMVLRYFEYSTFFQQPFFFGEATILD